MKRKACEKGFNRFRVPGAAIRCELAGPLIAPRTQIPPRAIGYRLYVSVTFPEIVIFLRKDTSSASSIILNEMVMMFRCGPALLKEPNKLSFLMRVMRKGIKNQWGKQCIFLPNTPYLGIRYAVFAEPGRVKCGNQSVI
jgi:hypothetical protein